MRYDEAVEANNLKTAVLVFPAAAIRSTTSKSQDALVEELKRLANHVSWHLREDRSKYQNRGTDVS